jgi:Xaa-Pro aminopeptidase
MKDARIRKLMENGICLIEQTVDLFYLTNLSLTKGRLLIGEEEAILFVDGRYYEKAKKEAPCSVMKWEEQKKVFEKYKQIGFDSAAMSYDGHLALKSGFPGIEWVAMPNPLRDLRAVKEPKEIEALKRAANLTWRGYQKIVEGLKVGVSEEELAIEFEIFCLRNGASEFSFKPIVAFGENSAYPHYRAGKTRLRENQIVLVDVGAVVDEYHGDMTRVHHFGEIDPELLRLEQIVKRAQKMAVDHIRPGVRVGDLDQIVRDEFDKENVKPLYIHSLGHGVGLETHEHPRQIKIDSDSRDLVLKPGMVITVEPGLYQPGLGGIRIEDMVLVTETGHENFFRAG